MALKVVNTESLDAVANAINSKAGTSGKLQFPDGFVEAVEGISAGGGGDGYDVATLQKFVDSRGANGLDYLYKGNLSTPSEKNLTNSDLEWLTKVDLSNCTTARYMFSGCESDNLTEIPLFDMSHITDMQYMFEGYSNNSGRGAYLTIPAFDTSNVTNMSYAFYNRLLLRFPQLKYDKAINMSYAFYEVVFRYSTYIGFLDFPSATRCNGIFSGCDIGLKSCEGISAPNCKEFGSAFYQCSQMETVGDIISNATGVAMNSIFYGCGMLTSFGKLPSSVSNYSYAFASCSKLTRVHALETETTTNTGNMFYQDVALETVEYMDMRSVTSCSSMFYGCKALTNITIKNIKCNLTVGSGTSWGHLLTVDSLVGLCYELCDTGSTKTLTVGSANLTKLASVYVRSIEITDAMRAEDDLIDEKLPFEVCDSTDEGATLIADYVLLKNWKLA